MNTFNLIAGICSIASLMISVVTLGMVTQITINNKKTVNSSITQKRVEYNNTGDVSNNVGGDYTGHSKDR